MSEIIICVALKKESAGLFEKIIAENSKNEMIHLVYTNVGKVNASYFLTKKIYELKNQGKKINYVLNLGTAGGKNLKKGDIVYSNKFIQRDFDHTPLGLKAGINKSYYENYHIENEYSNLYIEHKKMIDFLPNVICGTGDNFETKSNAYSVKIPELEKSAEEMEAYALALVCKYENLDFIAIKYISDEIILDTNCKTIEQDDEFQDSLNECAIKLSNLIPRLLNL